MLVRSIFALMAAFIALAIPMVTLAAYPDLMVCLAYSERSGQLSCCAEFGISETNCTEQNRGTTSSGPAETEADSYFYCKYKNLDGTGLDMAKWGRGTDFKWVPSRKVWEWRTEYVVQTIDANGGYYQKALQPIFSDQVGRCGPEVEREYKKKIKEIMDKHRK